MLKAVQAAEDILREEKGNVAIHCHSYGHQKALFDKLPEDLRQRLIIHARRDREESLREWMQSRGKVFLKRVKRRLVKAYGRAVRAEDDKARFCVVDGSFQRLVRNCWPEEKICSSSRKFRVKVSW